MAIKGNQRETSTPRSEGAPAVAAGPKQTLRQGRADREHRRVEAKVAAAAPVFEEIMGREMDSMARVTVLDMGIKNATKHWATSQEALGRGVDPTKYGAKEISEEDIGGGLKPYYEEWRKRNPNAPLFDTTRDYLRWAKGQGGVGAFTSELDGLIKTEAMENGTVMRYVTPEAVARMGGEVDIKGSKAGVYWVAPEGVKWKGGESWHTIDTRDGLTSRYSMGSPSDGILGLGSDAFKWMPKEISAPLNLLSGNVAPRLFGGSESYRKENREQRRVFGDSATNALEPISQFVITALATAFTAPAGGWGGVAVQGAFNAGRASANEMSWGRAAGMTAAAAAPVVGQQYGAVGTGVGVAAGAGINRAIGANDMGPAAIAASGLTAYAFAPYTSNWAAAGMSSGLQAAYAGGGWKDVGAASFLSAAGAAGGSWGSVGAATALAAADRKNAERHFTSAIGDVIMNQGKKPGEKKLGTSEALQGVLSMGTRDGASHHWQEFVARINGRGPPQPPESGQPPAAPAVVAPDVVAPAVGAGIATTAWKGHIAASDLIPQATVERIKRETEMILSAADRFNEGTSSQRSFIISEARRAGVELHSDQFYNSFLPNFFNTGE